MTHNELCVILGMDGAHLDKAIELSTDGLDPLRNANGIMKHSVIGIAAVGAL